MNTCRGDAPLTPTEKEMSDRLSIVKSLLASGADLSVSKLTILTYLLYEYKPLMEGLVSHYIYIRQPTAAAQTSQLTGLQCVSKYRCTQTHILLSRAVHVVHGLVHLCI